MKLKKIILSATLILIILPLAVFAQAQNDAEKAVANGVTWLEQAQKPNGAWSDERFPALTALALWAVSASKQGDKLVIDKAVDFILSNVRSDGGIYCEVPGQKGGGLSNYNTAICMMALHATGRKELYPVIRNARSFVAAAQYSGEDVFQGGFGYDRDTKRNYTDLMNTHFAVESMRRTESVEDSRPPSEVRADVNWEQVLQFVEKLQNTPEAGKSQEGGFFYHPTDPKAGIVTNSAGKVFLRSYGSMTYAGLLSMVYANLPANDPRVVSALNWAGRHWTLEENPGMGQQGLFFFFNVIARALTAANRDLLPGAAGGINWRKELIERVITLQNADGSWVNNNGRFWENDPVLSTAYAVLALEFAAGITR